MRVFATMAAVAALAAALTSAAMAGPFDDLGSAVEGANGSAKTQQGGALDVFRAKQADADAAADALPLTAQVAVFVDHAASVLGDYDIRSGNEFKPTEPVLFYIEPLGLTFKSANGLLTYGVSADLMLLDGQGATIFQKDKYFALDSKTRTRRRDVYLTGSLGIKTLPPGSYTLQLLYHDLNSSKTMTTSQPFKVVAAS